MCVCFVCVCVCVSVRACVRACVRVCVGGGGGRRLVKIQSESTYENGLRYSLVGVDTAHQERFDPEFCKPQRRHEKKCLV